MRLTALLLLPPLLLPPPAHAAGVDTNNDGHISILWVIPPQPDTDTPTPPQAAAAITAMATADQRHPFTLTLATNTCHTLAGAAWFPEGAPIRAAISDPRHDLVILSERGTVITQIPALTYAGISALREKLPPGARPPLIHLRGQTTPQQRQTLQRIATGTKTDIIAEDLIRANTQTGGYTQTYRGTPQTLADYLTAATFYSIIFKNRYPPYLQPTSHIFTERHQQLLSQMIQKTADQNRRPAAPLAAWTPPTDPPTFSAPPLTKGTPINETQFLSHIRQAAENNRICLPTWPIFLQHIAPSPLWHSATQTERIHALTAMNHTMRTLLTHGLIQIATDTPLAAHCTKSAADFILRTLVFHDNANAVILHPHPLAFSLWRPPAAPVTLHIATDHTTGITLTPDRLTFTTGDFAQPHPVTLTRQTPAPATLHWYIHSASFPGIRSGRHPLPPPE